MTALSQKLRTTQMTSIKLYMGLSCALASCNLLPADIVTEDQALDRANEHLAKQGMNFSDRIHRVVTEGQTWNVSFEPDPDASGGNVVVRIDRSTGRVLSVNIEQ